jgi:hypothetical protein
MKVMKSLFASVLALATVGAVAQTPQQINPGFQNSPSIYQVGGQDGSNNSYFAKNVFIGGLGFLDSLQVGMTPGPAAAVTGAPSYTTGTVAAGANYAKCVAVDWYGGIALPSTESALVTTTAAGSITWTCTPVPYASYYQVWVGATSNGEANWFPTPSGSNVLTQTLPIASGNAGTLPTAATSGGVVLNSGSRKGTFTCTSGGTIVVANALYLATSDVVISWKSGTAAVGNPYITASTPGTSFSATCGTGNTAVYNYNILN